MNRAKERRLEYAGRVIGALAHSLGTHREAPVVIPAQLVVEIQNDRTVDEIKRANAYKEKMWAWRLVNSRPFFRR